MSASETMKATADAWLTGFKHWDVEELVAPRADDCVHEIYPTTMGIPPSTNADFRAFFEPLKSFKDAKVRHFPLFVQITHCRRSLRSLTSHRPLSTLRSSTTMREALGCTSR